MSLCWWQQQSTMKVNANIILYEGVGRWNFTNLKHCYFSINIFKFISIQVLASHV